MFGKKAREIKRLRELIRSNEQIFAGTQRLIFNMKRILEVPEGGDVVAYARSLKLMHEENRTLLEGAAKILQRMEEASASTLMPEIPPEKRKRAAKKTKKSE